MRVVYWGLVVWGVVLGLVGAALFVVRVVNGPTNVLLPGMGLVVALELFIFMFLAGAAVSLSLAWLVRRSMA
jgi:hypothetical protein